MMIPKLILASVPAVLLAIVGHVISGFH